MSFFKDFAKSFDDHMNDPEKLQAEKEKVQLNNEIGEALKKLKDEADAQGYDFSYVNPALGAEGSWVTYYNGKMILITDREVAQQNAESLEVDTYKSIQKVLMSKVKLVK